MFSDIPENYRSQTADNEEEGWRYTQGDRSARRPPELLTRDHVARCIRREVREGRGSPHGGVFLDISWISKKLKNAEEHIKRKLPSMYHQFKELADIDITKEPMEVGPTTHYVMGGVLVDADTQMSSVPGPARRRRVRGGDQRREPAGRELALRPARVREARRRPCGGVRPEPRRQATGDRSGAGARRRNARRSSPSSAAGRRAALCRPARPAGAHAGQRRHRADGGRDVPRAGGRFASYASVPRVPASRATATTIPAGTPRSTCRTCSTSPRPSRARRSSARRAAAATIREDFPTRTPSGASRTSACGAGRTATMQLSRRPLPEMPPELRRIIQENQ